jgi:hypothetical protein
MVAPQAGLATLALTFNAFTWGVSWWPFRWLQERGLHALWATVMVYAVALILISVWRPQAWGQLWRTRSLWWIVLAAGATNASFNTAVTIGDVVRVVLLFYLMPAWSVLLAWRLLGERPTPAALTRLLLAFGGVALVLVPEGTFSGGSPGLLRGLSLADGLALFGGFTFALTNVLLRRLQAVPAQARMLAMFSGCMAMGLFSAFAGSSVGLVPPLPAPQAGWMLIAAGLAVLLMLGNWALQFGAARLPAGVTAVVMLAEVVFASVSSVLIAGEVLTPRTLLGGACIIAAALLSALAHARRRGA